ncbi:MAG: glycosyltransferase family 4 protein [Acidobacteria bacterium]|nr:glycosyltransferase family 4 protein [Acidobacteriota bacterium]
MGRIRLTTIFFLHVLRDLVGTLGARLGRVWRRLVRREKIGIVGVDVFPFFERMTGVGWYEWNLLSAMDRRDDGLRYNLYAHTFLAPSDPAAPAMPGSHHMKLRIHHVPVGLLMPLRPTMWFLRRILEPLLRILDGNDVLFAPNFFMPRSQLPFGPTVVATVHDLAFKALPDTVNQATLDELERNLAATLARSSRLIAVSEATARDITEYLDIDREQVRIIHEGLDPDFPGKDHPAPPSGLPSSYVLFVSTLEPRKNVVGILEAFAIAVDRGYSGHLVLVGRWGWRTENIRKTLETSPAKDRIIHLDYVERRQLAGLYREADAFLFPSWLEGFGLPLLEAMACGTPVVTSNRSAMPEVAGSAALCVDPADPSAIASALMDMLENPDHKRALSEAGRRRAALFSWDEAAAATAQVLRQAAGLKQTGSDEYRV